MIVFPSSAEKHTSGIMHKNVLFNEPQDGNRRGEIVIDAIVPARELDLPFSLKVSQHHGVHPNTIYKSDNIIGGPSFDRIRVRPSA
jgi:hypothetical protein